VAGVGNWVRKIEIRISHIQSDIETLKARDATIERLVTGKLGVGTPAPASGIPVAGGMLLSGGGINISGTNNGRCELYNHTNSGLAWGFEAVGQNLEFQCLEGGRWVTKCTVTPTGLVEMPVLGVRK